MSGVRDELLAYVEGLIASNRRMARCLRAFGLEQRGEATRAQVLDVCKHVTERDLRGE